MRFRIGIIALTCLGIGFGIGFLFPRVAHLGTDSVTVPPAAGIRIEELTSAEEMFAMAGDKAVIFKHSGGNVEFWIELESHGKTQKIDAGLRLEEDTVPAKNQTVEGYFLLVRAEPDSTGSEVWKIAHRIDAVASKRSGVHVSTPLVEAKLEKSEEGRKSASASTRQVVQVWNEKRGGSLSITSVASSIPSPLPLGKEICLKETREERKHGTAESATELTATGASTVGLLSAAAPLLVAPVLNTRFSEPADVHTIKVKCRAVAGKAREG